MNREEFDKLFRTVEMLRHPEKGCPWDLEQTHQSLLKYLIEESYEYIDAVERKNSNDMKDELGDVLLQVLLHSVIAEQEGSFDFAKVCENLDQKLIRRHPHVFDNLKVDSSEEVLKNWEEIKKTEKGNTFKYFINNKDLMNTALKGADKIGKKSKKVNFDWPNYKEVIKKVDEEWAEVKEAIESDDNLKIEEELGDLLFSVAQLTRHFNLDSENTLRKANKKFLRRFNTLEDLVMKEGHEINDLTSEELENFWQKVKKIES